MTPPAAKEAPKAVLPDHVHLEGCPMDEERIETDHVWGPVKSNGRQRLYRRTRCIDCGEQITGRVPESEGGVRYVGEDPDDE